MKTLFLTNTETGFVATAWRGDDRDDPPKPAKDYVWVTADALPNPISWEPVPVPEPPDPQAFPEGIETPSVILPKSLTHDYELHVVDGVLAVDQISASPRKSTAERDAIKAERRERIDVVRRDLSALLDSSSVADLRQAVRLMAELMNLVKESG